MAHIVEHEGIARLFKGIGPQILKGVLVQGLLMMTKQRYVHLFSTQSKHWKTLLLLGD